MHSDPPVTKTVSFKRKFAHAAQKVATATGSWQAFAAAAALIIGWLIAGIWVGYADAEFQLFINTVTTIITFMMVFLIQHAQNHDTAALHAKLDEIIRAIEPASNDLIAVEEMPEDVIATTRAKAKTHKLVEGDEALIETDVRITKLEE